MADAGADSLVPKEVMISAAKEWLARNKAVAEEGAFSMLLDDLEADFGSSSVENIRNDIEEVLRDHFHPNAADPPAEQRQHQQPLEQPAQPEEKAPRPTAEPSEPPAKRLKQGSSGGEGGFSLALSQDKKVTTSWYNGQKRVDIRAYYTRGDGEEMPTKKGISLNVEQWKALRSVSHVYSQALSAGIDKEISHDLGSMKKISLSSFKNMRMVDIREYYDNGKGLAPGKKGISLVETQWDSLMHSVREIDTEMGVTELDQGPPAASAATLSVPVPSAAGERAPVPQLATKNTNVSDGDLLKLEITPNRLAKVRTFKGRMLVDIREHYSKDGQLLPGKKGLSLQVEQFRKMGDAASAITAAAESKNTAFAVDLGSMKRITISDYNGRNYVDLREWYKKADGSLGAGKKGISLGPDQWNKLCSLLPELQRATA